MKSIFLILAIILSLMGSPAFAKNLVIIVNASNPVSSLKKGQVEDYFFKKIRTWPNGQSVRFFDRSENSQLRKIFLNNYIEKTSRQVDQYWIAQKFNTGDSAPTPIPSDSLTMSLVSRFPGGIGYISDTTELEGDVKIIEVTGP